MQPIHTADELRAALRARREAIGMHPKTVAYQMSKLGGKAPIDPRTIKSWLAGDHDPTLPQLLAVVQVLGLRLYIGLPETGGTTDA